MNKCITCKLIIPPDRMYCSKLCTQRAWYIRQVIALGKKSIYTNKKEFYKTETGKGFKWEKYVAKKLGGTHLEFAGSNADVITDKYKIDVKSCELYKRKNRRGKPVVGEQYGNWIFNRNKEKSYIDYFYCVCLKKGKKVKEYMIPKKEFTTAGITIGKNSKYDKWLV